MTTEEWANVCRPGYLGRHRDEKYSKWNGTYGAGNWRLVWKINGETHNFEGMCPFYEESYFQFLKRNPRILKMLVTKASDVYDDSPTNLESGFNYGIQETDRTHVQDIAIRRAVRRLGLKFTGKRPVRIRASQGTHVLSRILYPGKVPFYRPGLIQKPELKGRWWTKDSVEAFYQSNKFLQARISDKKPYLIGIAGPSCSGKSSLCELLEQEYKEVTHIRQDNFFKNLEEFPMYKKWRNQEVPGNVKFGELYDSLVNLKEGRLAKIPTYSKKIMRRTGTKIVRPNKIIVVEGFLLFYPKKIRDLFNLKIFLRVSEKEQLKRRQKRQKNLDLGYYQKVIIPMHEKYGAAAASYADYVIDADKSLDSVESEFDRIIAEKVKR